MKVNVATWDRLLRYLFGILGLSWAIAGGPFWAFLAVYLIVTAGWGICPVYGILKIQTYRPPKLN